MLQVQRGRAGNQDEQEGSIFGLQPFSEVQDDNQQQGAWSSGAASIGGSVASRELGGGGQDTRSEKVQEKAENRVSGKNKKVLRR